MEGPDQATLKKLWTSGRRGTLCPKEMMKAWGIAWCMKNYFDFHTFGRGIHKAPGEQRGCR